MNFFKDSASQIEFRLENVLSLGVRRDTFCGYDIPIILSGEDATKISNLAKACGVRNPIRWKRMYLWVENLSNRQRKELLNNGSMNILIHFRVIGVCTKSVNNNHHLILKVTKLRKLVGGSETKEETPED